MTTRLRIEELAAFDIAAYLDSEAAITAYLDDIRLADDPALLAAALEDVAQARARNKNLA